MTIPSSVASNNLLAAEPFDHVVRDRNPCRAIQLAKLVADLLEPALQGGDPLAEGRESGFVKKGRIERVFAAFAGFVAYPHRRDLLGNRAAIAKHRRNGDARRRRRY